MEKRLIQINPELVIKKCDKCCASCDFLKDRGTWYQCLKDSKEHIYQVIVLCIMEMDNKKSVIGLVGAGYIFVSNI